jgi:ubiquinone/menaquinone biosynthesis C-methylase UbiE
MKKKNVDEKKLFAKVFDQFYFVPSSALIRSIEAKLLSRIQFRKPILDLGCGNGMFTSFVSDNVDAGIDISLKAINLASKRKIYKELKQADASQNIPYPDNYFSSIFSNSTLEHIKNLDGALKEANRVLKINGDFIFTVPTEKFPFKAEHYKHYNMLNLKKWKEKLRKHGFKIVEYKYYLSKPTIETIKKLNSIFEIGFIVNDHGIQIRQFLKIPKIRDLFKNYFKTRLRKYYDDNSESGSNLLIKAKKIRNLK